MHGARAPLTWKVRQRGWAGFPLVSSQLALDLFREKGGKPRAECALQLSDGALPWQPVTQALIIAGVVEKEGAVYYVKDTPWLVQMVSDGKAWKEIGLGQLYGR